MINSEEKRLIKLTNEKIHILTKQTATIANKCHIINAPLIKLIGKLKTIFIIVINTVALH